MFRIPVRPDLELRLADYAHAPVAYALVQKNREHLRRFLPWVDHTWSETDIADWVRRGLEQLQRNEGWQSVLWYNGGIAGAIGYKTVEWVNMRVEIGYWLGAEFQGKGLMTDAARVVTDHAFREWGLQRVEIRCAVENVKSANVARRLGFQQEGLLRQAFKVRDHYQDLLVFAMVRDEWLSQYK